jgi:hypothetical protein
MRCLPCGIFVGVQRTRPTNPTPVGQCLLRRFPCSAASTLKVTTKDENPVLHAWLHHYLQENAIPKASDGRLLRVSLGDLQTQRPSAWPAA